VLYLKSLGALHARKVAWQPRAGPEAMAYLAYAVILFEYTNHIKSTFLAERLSCCLSEIIKEIPANFGQIVVKVLLKNAIII
jgi:hypothetical protein